MRRKAKKKSLHSKVYAGPQIWTQIPCCSAMIMQSYKLISSFSIFVQSFLNLHLLWEPHVLKRDSYLGTTVELDTFVHLNGNTTILNI